MNLNAVILAGGASRRMGRDKAWLEADGQPLILRALTTIRAAEIHHVFISGRPGTDYSAVNCPVLFDPEPGLGPVAGIATALGACEAPLLLVLAVDLPIMTPAFLRKLMAHCDTETGTIPELNGKLEPLAAIYPKRCASIARECLLSSGRAARAFAELCLREKAARPFPVPQSDAGCFKNWNSPADIAPP